MDTSYMGRWREGAVRVTRELLRAPPTSDGGSIVGSFNTLVSDATPFQHLEISEPRMAINLPEQVRMCHPGGLPLVHQALRH